MRYSFTALIPFYNENHRLISVVSKLQNVPELSEIVCVDDGSTDNSSHLLRTHFPGVKIFSTPKNLGKTEAVRYGCRYIQTQYTLLFDADMREFSAVGVSKTLQTFESNPELDHLIFRQENDPLILKLLRLDLLASGERVVSTEHLRKALHARPKSEYELELLLNQYSLAHSLTCAYTPFHARNYFKLQKWDWSTSLKKTWEFQKLLLSAEYLRQATQFFPTRMNHGSETSEN